MRDRNDGERMRAWVVDYSEATTRAIAWLGDRYLLARPVKKRRADMRPSPAFLAKARNEIAPMDCGGEPTHIDPSGKAGE